MKKIQSMLCRKPVTKALTSWLLALFCGVNAADYFVATTGSDDNAGTSIDAPFRTIARAAAGMAPGDRCLIREGTYRETLRPVASGLPQFPITFAAYQGERVTLTGTDRIAGWTLHSGRIYKAAMPWELGDGRNQVFVDGEMAVQARYPNTGRDPMHPTLENLIASTTNVVDSGLNQTAGFWNGATVVGGFGERWSFQAARVLSSVPGSLVIGEPTSPWFVGTGRGYVTGVLGALDTENEWHYEAGTVYLWAPRGSDPTEAIVEAKHRIWCIDINGRSNIVVRGINCFVGSIRLKSNRCTLDGCSARYLSHFTYFPGTGWDAAAGADEGQNGVYVAGNDNLITDCTFQYSAGSGVVLRGDSNAVTRCVIREIDYSGTYSCPVSVGGRGNRIWSNSIFNSGRDLIQLYAAKGADIRFNDLFNCGLLCNDLGATYQWGADGEGTRISYNWIHGNLAGGPGVYVDNYCRNFIVDHNVIWNFRSAAGIQLNRPASGIQVYNNTLFLCDDLGTHTYDAWPADNPDPGFWTTDRYQHDSRNNLFLGEDPGSQLMDHLGGDFTLKSGAKAIDSGVVIPGFTDGYSGGAPDAGAYESGGERWTAGALPFITATLPPVGDVYVDPVEGTWGSGQNGDAQNVDPRNDVVVADGRLVVGRTGGSGGDRRAFLSFDLGQLPPGTVIGSATLRLYLEGAEPWGSAYLRQVTGRDWDAGTVSYSLGSDADSTPVAVFSPPFSPTGWYQVDVTRTVNDWVQGASPNYGFALRADEGYTSDSRQFVSSRGDFDRRPRLIIRHASSSRLVALSVAIRFDGGARAVLSWPSEANRLYTLRMKTSLAGPWLTLRRDLPATPPLNTSTVNVGETGESYYQLQLQ